MTTPMIARDVLVSLADDDPVALASRIDPADLAPVLDTTDWPDFARLQAEIDDLAHRDPVAAQQKAAELRQEALGALAFLKCAPHFGPAVVTERQERREDRQHARLHRTRALRLAARAARRVSELAEVGDPQVDAEQHRAQALRRADALAARALTWLESLGVLNMPEHVEEALADAGAPAWAVFTARGRDPDPPPSPHLLDVVTIAAPNAPGRLQVGR